MRKLIALVFLISFSASANACVCATIKLADRIGMSDFSATAKILSIVPDANDENYHNIEIQLFNVYKGPKTTKLKIYSALNSSCAFYTPKDTQWLIFASYNKEKELIFGYCSGAQQLDKKFDLIEYPTLNEKVKNTLNLKTKVLRVLAKNNIHHTNELKLDFFIPQNMIDSLKGFKGKSRDFSIHELTLNENLSINKIKTLKRFKNPKLNRKFLNIIKNNIGFSKPKAIPSRTKLYLIYYFYPVEESYLSFISSFDI